MKSILLVMILSLMATKADANFAVGLCVGNAGKAALMSKLKECEEKLRKSEEEIQELKEKVKEYEKKAENK